MQKSLVRKGLVIGIIVLFVTMFWTIPVVESDDDVIPELEYGIIFLQWTDGTRNYNNFTFADKNCYYELNVAPGIGNLTSCVLRSRSSESVWLFNMSKDFVIPSGPCEVWRNITMYFPNDTATIYGHVCDDESNPIENALITVDFLNENSSFLGSNSTTTNISGYYEINLPASQILSFGMTADGYESRTKPGFFIGSESQEHNFSTKLLPPGGLRGQIHGLENWVNPVPLDDVTVYIEGIDNSFYNITYTNESGYYKINLSGGHYNVTVVEGNEYLDATADVWITPYMWTTVDFDLGPYEFPANNSWIEGYILDDQGSPIENANVTVYGSIKEDFEHEHYFNRYNWTDVNGYYNISVPAIDNNFPDNYSVIYSVGVSADDYIPDSIWYDDYQIITPGDVFVQDFVLYLMPVENCKLKGYIYVIGGDPPSAYNRPPYQPSDPNPGNGETGVANDTYLSWTGGDPDFGDVVTYDVYFGISSDNLYQVAWNQTDTFHDPGMLSNSTTYYWKIVAWDFYGLFNSSIIWNFITELPGDSPVVNNENPVNLSTDVERPPSELNATVEDPDSEPMDVRVRWKNHDGNWVTLETYTGVYNGTYNFTLSEINDWIWGNTTYVWSVNVTDGTYWTNETYEYTTSGSRYDVSNNDLVNFQDAGLVWVHRTSEEPYDGIYDVNQDGQVNFQDAGLTWVNRD